MPQQNNAYGFFNSEFMKPFTNYSSVPSVDTKAFAEAMRKNTEAMNEAMQLAGEGSQAFAQRCSEIMSQFVEDQSTIAKEMFTEGSPEEKIAKQTDIMKKNYEKSVLNVRELSDMISKSNIEASNIINKRVSASLGEIKSMLDKTNSNEKKSA